MLFVAGGGPGAFIVIEIREDTAGLLPLLQKQPRATVMNVTSGLAFIPLAMTPTYSATKAALHSYTESLRYQLMDTSVDVIELAPPYVATYLMGESQAADPGAMPLGEFISEVMEILTTQPGADEVLVKRVQPLRFSAMGGPVYREIARSIMRRLEQGAWKPGEAIPSETRLKEEFGVAIGTFPSIRAKLVQHAGAGQAARLLTLRAAWLDSKGKATDEDMAMAKVFSSEMCQFVTDEAIQILGGMGLMDELPLERMWRDTRVDRIWDGTSEIQRHIISRELLRPLGA